MKGLCNKFPKTSRFFLAIVLFGFALVLSSLIDNPFLKQYFPYSSAVLLCVATWLLYKKENNNLNAIGLNLKSKNLYFLVLGLVVGALALFGAKFARALYAGEQFALNDVINYEALLYGLYTILPTVAVEEFLFRGYLFKKTIEVSNVILANVIFSVVFMAIHVLDENVLQNKGHIILLIITIPVGHLLFATALLKSKTLYFPIGLHLGNNWATQHLITPSKNGESIFYTLNNATFNTWPYFIGSILIFNGVFVLVILLIWKWDQLHLIKGYCKTK